MRDFSNEITMVTPRRNFFGRIAAMAAVGVAGLATTAAHASRGAVRRSRLAGKAARATQAGGRCDRGQFRISAYLCAHVSASKPVRDCGRYSSPQRFANRARQCDLGKVSHRQIVQDRRSGNQRARKEENPFLRPKAGVLPFDDMSIDRLFARGTVFGSCNLALQNRAKRLAMNAGVSVDEAIKEWTANLVPGITNLPSGTWGVNRAQEAGCTYCAGA